MAPIQKKKKGRILIIEDNPAIQKMTEKILNFGREFDVTFANNGNAGLRAILNSERFDVIVMDIEMPEMDGEKCIKRIRALDDPVLANTPVIACTGNPNESTPADFKSMGFNDSFVKPVNYKGLIEKIAPILAKIRK